MAKELELTLLQGRDSWVQNSAGSRLPVFP